MWLFFTLCNALRKHSSALFLSLFLSLTHISEVTQGQQADVDQRVILWVLVHDGHQPGDNAALHQLSLLHS